MMNYLTLYIFYCISVVECVPTLGTLNASKYIDDAEVFFRERCEPQCIYTRNLYDHRFFRLGVVTPDIISLFPRQCSKVCTEIILNEYSDVTEEQLISAFQNITHLVGSLHVNNTQFKSGKFFASLETLECGIREFLWHENREMIEFGLNNLTTVICSEFELDFYTFYRSNAPLTMPNLKNFTSNKSNKKVKVNINGVAVTIDEAMNLFSNLDVDFESSKLDYIKPHANGTLCYAASEIPEGCKQIFGDLKINEDNEHQVSRLKTVEVIFGGLVITHTSLESIDFFDNLKYILSLNIEAINFQYNANLTNFTFPSVKRVFSYFSVFDVVFWQNGKVLSNDPIYCERIHHLFNMTAGEQNAIFDGKSCDLIKKEFNNGRSEFKWAPMILFFLIFIYSFDQ